MSNLPDGAEQDVNAPWNKEDEYDEVTCEWCDGSGWTNYDLEGADESHCFNCSGTGIVLIEKPNKWDLDYDEDR